MAIKSTLKSKKIRLRFAEGSQTLSQVAPTATDTQCYNGGVAFAGVCNERTKSIDLIEEETLVNE